MEKPPHLKPGDNVVILSTARKISEQEVQVAVHKLKEWGLVVHLADHLFAEDHQFAGSDEARTLDFQKALDNDSIKAIFCARGGYGTVRIIDRLDFSRFQRSPKWIVGYSDVTVLHSHIHENIGVCTLHATMPINYAKNSVESLKSLHDALFGVPVRYQFGGNECNVLGTGKGQIIGGNLSILYSLTGTSSSVDTKGKILFIEDLDEYLYHLDRMMLNLNRAGMLKDLSGLVVGAMTTMHDNAIPFGKTAHEIILDTVKAYGYPVCFDFPSGHIDDNHTLILGNQVEFVVDADGVNLKFL